MASLINASTSPAAIVQTADGTANLNLQSNGTTIAALTSTGMAVTGTLSASGVTTFAAGTAALPAITTTGDTDTGVFFPAANTVAASTSGTERMRIDSSGNLLVGTTTTNGRITVHAESDEAVWAKNTAGGAAATMISWNNANTGNNYFHAFFTDTAGNNVGNIDYNRGAGLVRYQTTSDATLKNIIGDSNGQRSLEILNTTRIREFAWKSDVEQKPQIGVIAQELYETYKGAVSVGGENDEGKYKPWGVDKTAFTFHLIAGWQEHERIIQEQQALITSLTARITALEGA